MRISSNFNLSEVVQRTQQRQQRLPQEEQHQQELQRLPVLPPAGNSEQNARSRTREVLGQRVVRTAATENAQFRETRPTVNLTEQQKRAVSAYTDNQRRPVDDGYGEYVGGIDTYV